MAVYERRGKVVVVPQGCSSARRFERPPARVLGSGDWRAVGAAALRALAQYEEGLPEPPITGEECSPAQTALGIPTEEEFVRGLRLCGINIEEGEITVLPFKFKGLKRGFGGMPPKAIRVPATDDPEALGRLIAEGLSRSRPAPLEGSLLMLRKTTVYERQGKIAVVPRAEKVTEYEFERPPVRVLESGDWRAVGAAALQALAEYEEDLSGDTDPGEDQEGKTVTRDALGLHSEEEFQRGLKICEVRIDVDELEITPFEYDVRFGSNPMYEQEISAPVTDDPAVLGELIREGLARSLPAPRDKAGKA